MVRNGLLPGEFSALLDLANGARVGVVGLNTTFLQLADGNYTERLALDVRQFNYACTGTPDGDGAGWAAAHDVCLLMTHQGFDWLDPRSQKEAYPGINPAGRFAVHLFGHMHENVVRGNSSGGGAVLWEWQGNSLFSMEPFGDPPKVERRHGYSAGTIEFDFVQSTASLRHWPRKAVDKGVNGWDFDRDTESCVLDKLKDDGGTEAMPLRLRPRKREARPDEKGPFGLVLQAIRKLAWGSNAFVTDDQIAKKTRIPIGDVRDWIKTLEGDGYVDLVRTTDGQSAAITAKGRFLALGKGATVVDPEEADRLSMGPVIDLLDETNRLGRDPGRRMGERYLGLVEAIHARLESVHESYLGHFRKYREVIATWSGPFNVDHPIFDTLEYDHLFTQSDRLRLLAMTEAIDSTRLVFKEPERRKLIDPASASPTEKDYYSFMSFLSSINSYLLTTGYYGNPDMHWWGNRPRGDLLFCLRHLFGSKPDEVLQGLGVVERCEGERLQPEWSEVRGPKGRVQQLRIKLVGAKDDPDGVDWFEVRGSKSRMQQLQVELVGAKDDPDGVKRALALAKIDEIVGVLLERFRTDRAFLRVDQGQRASHPWDGPNRCRMNLLRC